ncbi:hypothetical protein OO185_04580 [Prosthecochloris sp. SCSIO W1102]|uniref:hypothetical protein n=1 Tax=Prosthecochloris sp. SCSIO W1102 TaxID=2992243 RepID=UPI00223E8547|nr:hypothetical protein [Prosthecochloris sp. SCSIO W1102]UZJ39214.1 hypothetical protein OO185_04580 [Prosthecochloris sp. SCSIO W1102]
MEISSDMVKLAESISAGYEERKKDAECRLQELEDLRKEVSDKLDSFQKQKQKMSEELQQSCKDLLDKLHMADKDLKSSVKELMDTFGTQRSERSAEQAKMLQDFRSALGDSVGKLMNDFESERGEKSAEQAKMLQEFRSALSDSVKGMLNTFEADHQSMKKMQGEFLSSMRNELQQGREALRNARKGDGGNTATAVEKPDKKKVDAVKSPEVAVQEAASVAKTENPVQAVEEKKDAVSENLEEQVLGFISSHPEGVRVKDMEGPLGANRMRLGVIAKKLYEGNKVKKEDNFYFPL